MIVHLSNPFESQPVPFDPVTQTYTAFIKDVGFRTDSLSFFAQGTLNITNRLELAAGARYSDESRSSYQISSAANVAFAAAFPGGITILDRYRDNDISPEVTLRFKPTPDMTLYAAYKKGFKAGGFNISQAITPATAISGGRYGAETAEGGEIGFRTLAFDRRLSFSITAYHYVYSDLQVQFFDPVTISQIAGNAGELKTQGIEADYNFQVPGIDGFSLRGAIAYSDAKYNNFIGQCYPGQTIAEGCNLQFIAGAFTAQDYDGRRPPKAPELAGRAGFTFGTRLSDSISLRVNGDVSYQSKYNFTDALNPDGVQSSTTKFDASIALHGNDDRWTVSLIGRNLTNELVVTAANDIPFAGGTGTGTATGNRADLSAFVDNHRQIYVELAFKF